MERFGFIHEKLDIKILILFILRHLPLAISLEELAELVLVDDGFDYFEYTQCLSELVDTNHVDLTEDGYKITQKGLKHGESVESSIPYTVRVKAEDNAKPIIERMKRDELIGTSHKILNKGGCMTKLSLDDDVGSMMSLSLLTADEEQSQKIEAYFRCNAEDIYQKLIEMLTKD